ncbi:hypothetical protein CC86DRAFT_410302 [Ophiobolus disseminans]|uniref:Uncharacterized protein n=1 Tax=Ophiobolus disseminans TaxID=1469910 RepID=A0A6A6ZNR8_9PLEO|nr:hypothetical protein CC86DRAFT_410302 [Ophiobolus disseminans]
MDDVGLRWSFGPRPQAEDEEATRPLLPQRGLTADRETIMIGSASISFLQGNYEEGRDTADFDGGRHVDTDGAYDALHTSLSSYFSDGFPVSVTSPSLADQQDMGYSFAKLNRGAGVGEPSHVNRNQFAPLADTTSTNVTQGSADQAMPDAPPAAIIEDDYGEPFLTLTQEDETHMERILTPVRGHLLRIQRTTHDCLPAYSAHMKARSHAQVLKGRLGAVGEHVREHLEGEAELDMEVRELGVRELKLCRFIATKYWPLPVTPTSHLHIQRTYRNALFIQTAKFQLRRDQKRHDDWVAEVSQQSRTSFGEAAARYARNCEAAMAVVDQDEAYAELLRQQERARIEAMDRRLAENLAREGGYDNDDEPPALVPHEAMHVDWEDDDESTKRAVAASLQDVQNGGAAVAGDWQAVQDGNEVQDAGRGDGDQRCRAAKHGGGDEVRAKQVRDEDDEMGVEVSHSMATTNDLDAERRRFRAARKMKGGGGKVRKRRT